MLIKKDPDVISSYLEDHSNIKNGFCNSVIFPENEEDVRSILISASKEKTPITVAGAGTGLTGGRVPFGGDIISTEKMSRIETIQAISEGEGVAVVQPGVVLEDFLKKVEEASLFYPPDPTEKSSFIGGNIATSASGARSFRFGTVRDYVTGLRAVLSSGEVVDIERGRTFCIKGSNLKLQLVSGASINVKVPSYDMPEIKNAAGYYLKDKTDIIDLFIGQEGTLGVITKIKFKLLKIAGEPRDCYAFFKKEKDALDFAARARDLSIRNRTVLSRSQINAMSLEFFDSNSIEFLRQRYPELPRGVSAAIFFEQDVEEETESEVLGLWTQLISACGGSIEDTWFAQNKKDIQRLKEIRHALPEMVNDFLKRRQQIKVGTDIAVPWAKVEKMIDYYHRLLRKERLNYVIFGHIGDGHLHVNVLPEDEKQYRKAVDLYGLFAKKGVFLGGTVSAEHGIGKLKHAYLEMMYGKEALREMADFKKSLDPARILGLDNIFPRELLTTHT